MGEIQSVSEYKPTLSSQLALQPMSSHT